MVPSKALSILRERLLALTHALRGLKVMVVTQPHARIHTVATLVVVTWGWLIRLSPSEWMAVALCIGMVWAAEALNTAIEFLADEVTLERRERIGNAKDASAAAVLVASAVSLVVWGLILWKRL
jgi:diacylglycerol kinase